MLSVVVRILLMGEGQDVCERFLDIIIDGVVVIDHRIHRRRWWSRVSSGSNKKVRKRFGMIQSIQMSTQFIASTWLTNNVLQRINVLHDGKMYIPILVDDG